MEGWIKLHRKIYQHPRAKDPDWVHLWFYLLTHCAYKTEEVIFKGNVITLQPGQLTTGRKKIEVSTGINRSKIDRLLKVMESEHQIEQQTSNKCRLITIKKWNEYQGSEHQIEQQVSNNRATSEQQVSTNKEIKNIKNIKKERKEGGEIFSKSTPTPKDDMKKFISAYEEKGEAYATLLGGIITTGVTEDVARNELEKFYMYWTEPSSGGKRQRWQLQKCFDVKRRMLTWFRNAEQWHKPEKKKDLPVY